jgi:hypothetical protein
MEYAVFRAALPSSDTQHQGITPNQQQKEHVW